MGNDREIGGVPPHIVATRRAERRAEKAEQQAEDRRYSEFVAENPEPTLAESRAYNEIGLLGSVMAGGNIEALRKVRGEFSDPFHENVAAVILTQADAGQPYDAAAVTAVLRTRELVQQPQYLIEEAATRPTPELTLQGDKWQRDWGYGPDFPWSAEPPPPTSQLPQAMDPAVPRRPLEAALSVPQYAPLDLDQPLARVDLMQYGLGVWQSNGIPDEANDLAVAVRADHRCRYMMEAGTSLTESASMAAQAGEDPGGAFTAAVDKLVNVPRPLDRNLQETSARSTAAVDTERREPKRSHRVPTPATVAELGLPPRPVYQTSDRLSA